MPSNRGTFQGNLAGTGSRILEMLTSSKAVTASYAVTASRLSVNSVGQSGQPVYFQNGVPTADTKTQNVVNWVTANSGSISGATGSSADTNIQVQELVRKSGSWENASTWVGDNSSSVSNTITKVSNLKGISFAAGATRITASYNPTSSSQVIINIPSNPGHIGAASASHNHTFAQITDGTAISASVKRLEVSASSIKNSYVTTASFNNFTQSVANGFLPITGGTLTGNLETKDVFISGNLTVGGTTTTIDAQNLNVKDKLILIASGSTTQAAANGAGIAVSTASAGEGGAARIQYLSSGNKFTSSVAFEAPSFTGSLKGTATNAVSASYANNASSATSASYAKNSDKTISASYASSSTTASYALVAESVKDASGLTVKSADTASYVEWNNVSGHPTFVSATFQAGAFSAKTYNPVGSAQTINIPTTTAHITGLNAITQSVKQMVAKTGSWDGVASTASAAYQSASKALATASVAQREAESASYWKTEASKSAANAFTYADEASGSMEDARFYRSQAATNATLSSTYAVQSSASAQLAAASASAAATSATNAANYATRAQQSASNAHTSKTLAAASASAASSSAATAANWAVSASASANQIQADTTVAANWASSSSKYATNASASAALMYKSVGSATQPVYMTTDGPTVATAYSAASVKEAVTASNVVVGAVNTNANLPVFIAAAATPTNPSPVKYDTNLTYNASTNRLNAPQVNSTGVTASIGRITQVVATGVTASGAFRGALVGNVTGNLTGTASYATSASRAVTSSYALVAESVKDGAGLVVNSASHAAEVNWDNVSNKPFTRESQFAILADVTGSALIPRDRVTFVDLGYSDRDFSIQALGESDEDGFRPGCGFNLNTGSIGLTGLLTSGGYFNFGGVAVSPKGTQVVALGSTASIVGSRVELSGQTIAQEYWDPFGTDEDESGSVATKRQIDPIVNRLIETEQFIVSHSASWAADTKVTSAANHYKATNQISGSQGGNNTTYVHAITLDAAGHVTAVSTTNTSSIKAASATSASYSSYAGNAGQLAGQAASAYALKSYADGAYLPITGGVVTGDLTVQKNFTVAGTTSYLNTTDLIVKDKLILVSSGSTTQANSDGAGIAIQTASATTIANAEKAAARFQYRSSDNHFTASVGIVAPSFTGSLSGKATSAGSADSATVATGLGVAGNTSASVAAAIAAKWTYNESTIKAVKVNSASRADSAATADSATTATTSSYNKAGADALAWITANSASATTNTDRYVNTAAFASTGSNGANGVKMTLTRAGSDTAQVTAVIPVASATAAGVVTGAQLKSWTSGSSWVGANSASIATAVTNNHTHSNKAVLDGISAADTASWDGKWTYNEATIKAVKVTSASRADSAASATSATSATKLVGTSGSTSVPVYINAGVPTAVTSINLANITASTGFRGNLTGTASYATSASRAVSAASATTASYITWANVSGKPSSFTPAAHNHNLLVTEGDYRATASVPNDYVNNFRFRGLKNTSTIGLTIGTGSYAYVLGLRGWSDSSGGDSHELAFNNAGIFTRHGATTSWNSWVKVITSDQTSSWDTAATNSHTHSNKAVLDGITAAKTASWDAKQAAISDLTTIRSNATNGNTAYGWGNHANAGYVKSSGVTSIATGTGLTGGPITSTGTMSIAAATLGKIESGSTAFGWGNHANAGYAKPADITSAVSALVTASGSKWSTDNDRYVATASFASTGSNGANGVKMTLTRRGSDTGTVVATIPVASTSAAGVMTGAMVTKLNGIATGATANTGTVTNVTATGGTGITASVATGTTTPAISISSAQAHVHSNKAVLDGITAADTASWDAKQAAISDLATIRTNAASGSVAFGWGNHADAGYVKSSGVTSVTIKATSPIAVSSTAAITGTGERTISVASGYAIPTTTQIANFSSATSSVHTHSNKAVLDGITAAMTASWQTAATNNHTHSNKAVLDGITAAMTASWQTAATNNHTHSNKAVLDGITAAKTASWDAAKPGTVTSVTLTTSSNYVVVDSVAAITTSGTRKIDLTKTTKGKIESGSSAFEGNTIPYAESSVHSGTIPLTRGQYKNCGVLTGDVTFTFANDFGNGRGTIYAGRFYWGPGTGYSVTFPEWVSWLDSSVNLENQGWYEFNILDNIGIMASLTD